MEKEQSKRVLIILEIITHLGTQNKAMLSILVALLRFRQQGQTKAAQRPCFPQAAIARAPSSEQNLPGCGYSGKENRHDPRLASRAHR